MQLLAASIYFELQTKSQGISCNEKQIWPVFTSRIGHRCQRVQMPSVRQERTIWFSSLPESINKCAKAQFLRVEAPLYFVVSHFCVLFVVWAVAGIVALSVRKENGINSHRIKVCTCSCLTK